MTHSTTPYRPQAGSLASQVLAFFDRCPDETLGLEEITTKFDATRGNIHTLLGKALEHGLVKRQRNQDGEYLYNAGAVPHDATLADAIVEDTSMPFAPGLVACIQAVDAVHRQQAKPRKHSKRRTYVDLAALQIEKNVPMPGLNNQPITWADKLKLLQPTDCYSVPIKSHAAIKNAVKKLQAESAARFTVATFDGETCRVWRTA